MKFDKIIMNPPYGVNRNGDSNYLHYYITESALEHLQNNGVCVSLMPISIISSLSSKKELKELRNRFFEKLIIAEEHDSTIFSDTSMKEICVYVLDNNEHKTFEIICKKCKGIFKNFSELNYGILPEENNFFEKIKKFDSIQKRSLGFYIRKENRNRWKEEVEKFLNNKKFLNKDLFICFNGANGGMDATWQSKKLNNIGVLNRNELREFLNNDKSTKVIVGFESSENERVNSIVNFANLKGMRFVLSKKQVDQNIQGKCYECFPDVDYSKIKTDEDFYKFFNITEDEQRLIEETMKKYK